VQDTHNVVRIIPQSSQDLKEQVEILLLDLPVSLVKIGLLGSSEIALAIAEILETNAALPMVLDPILAAGGGTHLASEFLIEMIKTRLIPRALAITPNTVEARKLAGEEDLDVCASRLLDLGCPNILLTGTHDEGGEVINRLYQADRVLRWRWPRLPYSYHGSGCTFASAIAAFLAQGKPIEAAAEMAQQYTWQTLQKGFKPGQGQHLPDRLHCCFAGSQSPDGSSDLGSFGSARTEGSPRPQGVWSV
jgi:hydroxymethylpyrimidine/phosphomethylpyrimidine kinase